METTSYSFKQEEMFMPKFAARDFRLEALKLRDSGELRVRDVRQVGPLVEVRGLLDSKRTVEKLARLILARKPENYKGLDFSMKPKGEKPKGTTNYDLRFVPRQKTTGKSSK